MTGACNHNGCPDRPTVRVVDAATGHVVEVFCRPHALLHACGEAARNQWIGENGKQVFSIEVVERPS